MNIYTLKLHEEVIEEGVAVRRVPGGWLYSTWDYDQEHWQPPVFVPYVVYDEEKCNQ